MRTEYSEDSYTITYSNFTWTDTELGESYSMDGTTISCTGLLSGNYNCETNADWEDPSGETYRYESSSVVGDDSSGYEVEVIVFDTENGYIEVTTTERIMYNCENGYPGAGEISITGSEETSASVSFDSCTGFTVNVVADGSSVASTFNWSDVE
jgi:hypothetical protein